MDDGTAKLNRLMYEESQRPRKKGLWNDLRIFMRYNRTMGFSMRVAADFARYANKVYIWPFFRSLVNAVPGEDEIDVISINADRLKKYPSPGIVSGEDVGELSVRGFDFSEWVGTIEGSLKCRSGLLEREFDQLWVADLTRVRYGSHIINMAKVGIKDTEISFPYYAMDFGLAQEYGIAFMKRYGFSQKVWNLVGGFYESLDGSVMAWLNKHNLVRNLFDDDMQEVGMDLDINLSTENDNESIALAESSIASGEVLPEHLLYVGEGASRFLDITGSEKYMITRKERDMLESHSPDIVSNCPKRPEAIIDLGVGDGSKARILNNHIEGGADYLMVDISPVMIYRAVSGGWDGKQSGIITPFNGLSRGDLLEGRPGLYLLLGNTYCNFNDAGQERLISRIGSMMEPHDSLLVGLETPKDPDELVRAYNDNASRMLQFNPLRLMGLEQDEFDYVVSFNEEIGQVEMRFIPNNSDTMAMMESLYGLKEGGSVLAAVSRRLEKDEFYVMASNAGIEPIGEYIDDGYLLSHLAHE